MSQAEDSLTPEQIAHFNDSRQTALWGSLSVFLVINNVAVAGRLWATWKTGSRQMPVKAEGISIVLSGVRAPPFPPVPSPLSSGLPQAAAPWIPAPGPGLAPELQHPSEPTTRKTKTNLMAATHYGLGLHYWTVNARDPHYPRNLSKTFMHIWITMVLMSSFFACIKVTLLCFYKRLFLMASSRLRVFWWANLVYVVLWFVGATGFYLFQCRPVQWYFLQHYERFGKPVPGGATGQCDAQKVTNVAMPVIFSLVSDLGLLVLPIAAIWNLRLSRWKKIGLFAVFGIGLLACLLELARIMNLLLDTDDKTDPSYGVANFLILTAAEETCAVACACLPVIGPQVYRHLKRTAGGAGDGYHYRYHRYDYYYPSNAGGQLAAWHTAPEGFRRVSSANDSHAVPTPPGPPGRSSVSKGRDCGLVPLQTVVVGGTPDGGGEPYGHSVPAASGGQRGSGSRGNENMDGVSMGQAGPALPGIHVRTEVQVVHSDVPGWHAR
ncbi:hypothetical protein VTH06DRAFT_291 [Thermothelomyces fergusii]